MGNFDERQWGISASAVRVGVAGQGKGAVTVICGGIVGLGLLLTLVGALAATNTADPTTTWAAFASIATVSAAVVAIWTLISLRQDSVDRSRPVMSAELRLTVLTTDVELRVTNAGQSVAKNVRVIFTPPLKELSKEEGAGLAQPYLRRRYLNPISTFAPGMVMDNVYQIDKDVEPVPDDFTITFDYQDVQGRRYTDIYEISMDVMRNRTAMYPHGRIDNAETRRAVQAIEAIARGVGRR